MIGGRTCHPLCFLVWLVSHAVGTRRDVSLMCCLRAVNGRKGHISISRSQIPTRSRHGKFTGALQLWGVVAVAACCFVSAATSLTQEAEALLSSFGCAKTAAFNKLIHWPTLDRPKLNYTPSLHADRQRSPFQVEYGLPYPPMYDCRACSTAWRVPTSR